MARVFNLSTFYADKGSIFDKDFLKDKKMRYNIAIDGKFGNGTLKALKDFQASSKLTVDGMCGPNTRRALIAAV